MYEFVPLFEFLFDVNIFTDLLKLNLFLKVCVTLELFKCSLILFYFHLNCSCFFYECLVYFPICLSK